MDMAEKEPEDLPATVETCKTLIPYVGHKDERWQNFPLKFFLVNSYAAHKTFYNVVVSKIDSLVREKAKKQREEEAAAKAIEFQRRQEEKEAA